MDTLEAVAKLFELIGDGCKTFIDFIIQLPSLFYNLLNCIPNPLHSILLFFLSLFLFLIVINAIAKLIATITGG